MDQPKYKFGDKVLDTREEKVIVVRKITQALDTFIYSDGIHTVPEKCAEAVQESKKKKLYAYREKREYWSHTCGKIRYNVIHFTEKEDSDLTAIVHFERVRDLDIEYPEPK